MLVLRTPCFGVWYPRLRTTGLGIKKAHAFAVKVLEVGMVCARMTA